MTLPVTLRVKLLKTPDATAATPYGLMNSDEFTQDLKVLLKTDPTTVNISSIYTNSIVPTLTAAEIATVKKSADDFVLTGVNGKITVPTIPADAP